MFNLKVNLIHFQDISGTKQILGNVEFQLTVNARPNTNNWQLFDDYDVITQLDHVGYTSSWGPPIKIHILGENKESLCTLGYLMWPKTPKLNKKSESNDVIKALLMSGMHKKFSNDSKVSR